MPRLGIGVPIVSEVSSAPVLVVQDFFWLNDISGELTPIRTSNRTNLVTSSEDFTSDWAVDDVTISANSTTAPDGTLTADKIIGNTVSSRHNIVDTGLTNNVTASISIHAKAGELRYLQIASANTTNQHANFDVLTGTIGNVGSDFANVAMDSLANGWYRITLTSVGRYNNFYLFLVSGLTASWFESWSMSNNTDGLFLWGAQLEEDSRVSAYIPTSGSTVTVSTTLNDTSNVWDFDGTDLMLEEDPDDEGAWEDGGNLVLNHDYGELGSNLVVNGTFETAVDNNQWTNFGSPTTTERSTTYAYEGTHSYRIVGDSNNDGTQASATQFTGDYSDGDVVEITAYVYPITASNNSIETGVSNSNRSITSAVAGLVLNQWNKVQYQVTISTASNNYITFLIEGSAGEFYLDNVSARIVDPNNRWTLGTGWSISSGKAVATASINANLQVSVSILNGNTYEFTYTVSDYSGSGTVKPMLGVVGAVVGTPVDANGTHTELLVANANQSTIAFRTGGTAFTGKIDNVTVKEYAAKPLNV